MLFRLRMVLRCETRLSSVSAMGRCARMMFLGAGLLFSGCVIEPPIGGYPPSERRNERPQAQRPQDRPQTERPQTQRPNDWNPPASEPSAPNPPTSQGFPQPQPGPQIAGPAPADAAPRAGLVSRVEGPSRLLFLSNRPGGRQNRNYDIYHARLDGSGVERLSDFPDRSIRWFDKDPRRDRLVIAYSTDGDLSVGPAGNHRGAEAGEQVIAIYRPGGELRDLIDIRPGGHNPEQFVGVDHPSFSPNGSRLVFSAHRRGESANLWIIHANGTNLRRLINDPDRTYDDPRFGADGRVVYTRHERQGAFQQRSEPDRLDIWILDPDERGSGRRVAREERIGTGPRIDTDPALSPDGSRVAAIRGTQPVRRHSIVRPLTDNALFPIAPDAPTPMFTLQGGADPDRVHGVPTWINANELLSYRWDNRVRGWRVIRYAVTSTNGPVQQLDLGTPLGSEDLLPLAY